MLAVKQLFTIANHRGGRYQDSFTLSILEVQEEKLGDLVSGTAMADYCGKIQGREEKKRSNRSNTQAEESAAQLGDTFSKGSKPTKLEIRTNYDGDTIVQGLISIPVQSFEDVRRVWRESLTARAARLAKHGIDVSSYEPSTHMIATLQVVSTNVATGVGTVGRIQFVDLAGADIVPRRNANTNTSKSKSSTMDGVLAGLDNKHEWKFTNKSLATLADVVNAKTQFSRSVPYRNSTLTHLLRDSLEADTKVLFIVCVSSDEKDLQETACALRFASQMRKVVIGNATKHTVGLA